MPPNQKPQKPIDLSAQEEPKHFVRTLESDTAALKQGAKPGFAEVEVPEEPVVPVVKENIIVHPSLPTPAPPPPKEIPIAKEPSEPASARIVAGSLLPSFEAPAVLEAPPPPPPPPPVPQIKAPIRTYSSDFSDHLNDTKASTASVLAAEGDSVKTTLPRAPSRYNLALIGGGVAFLLLGGIGGYATYTYVYRGEPITFTPTASLPIFVNEREEIGGSASELQTAIADSLLKTLPAGQVRLLSVGVATSTGSDLFHRLALPAPGALLRNISSVGSIGGVINSLATLSASSESATTPFFILSVTSYGDTFAGMLAWEPRLLHDLAPLYPRTSTSTGAFKDEVLANHDVRILRDAAGHSIVLYGYSNPSTLIIAGNENAYINLIERLSNSRTSH